jgi:2C-methyl-D-erythritol 2,4-cyclodiphosphate synthase
MLDNAMMKAYVAHSYSDMKQQSAVIDTIILVLEQLDIECVVFTRKYASFKINQEKEMMSLVFQEIERVNLLVVEMSVKRVGIGLRLAMLLRAVYQYCIYAK